MAFLALTLGGMHEAFGALGALVGHGSFDTVVGIGEVDAQHVDIQRICRQAEACVTDTRTNLTVGFHLHFVALALQLHAFGAYRQREAGTQRHQK